jgi:hypothetical protein
MSEARADGPQGTAGIALIGWSGCPSHDAMLQRLTDALDRAGHPEAPISIEWVETEEEAARRGFIGSPTVRIDGVDVDSALDPGAPTALTCRLYRTRAGRFSPYPDPDDLAEALARHFSASA